MKRLLGEIAMRAFVVIFGVGGLFLFGAAGASALMDAGWNHAAAAGEAYLSFLGAVSAAATVLIVREVTA